MTVYGLDYRPKPYAPTGALRRLWPLSWNEFRVLFRSKWGIALFLMCAFPSFVRLILMLIWLGVLSFGGPMRHAGRNAPSELREFVPTNVRFYVEQVVAPEQGLLVLLLLTALATARTIAKDRATNALELYWTRGIAPIGYFAAKWFGAFLLVAMLTVGVPLLLWLVGVFFAEDWSFFTDTAGFMPGAIAGLLVFTTTLTVLCVLVSAVAGSANVAMILWCLLLGGSSAVAQVLRELADSELGSWISVWDAAATLARGCAGIAQRGASVGGAAVLLGGLTVVLGLLARRRLRIAEAVG